MPKKINLKAEVEKILVKYPTARSSDTFVIKKVIKKINPNINVVNLEGLLRWIKLIKPDYIKRLRRDFQEHDKSLRDPKTYRTRQIKAGIIKAKKRKAKARWKQDRNGYYHV